MKSKVLGLVALVALAILSTGCESGEAEVVGITAKTESMVETLEVIGEVTSDSDSEPSFLCRTCANGKSGDDGQAWANAINTDTPSCAGLCSSADIVTITGFAPEDSK